MRTAAVITLYHCPCSRSSRIIWLLEELAAPYTIEQVSIFRPLEGSGAPDPRNPHPDKRVPAVDHDGVLLAETVAIILYLTDAFPQAGLGPAPGDPGRGDYLTWLAWYPAEMEPAVFARFDKALDDPIKRRGYEQVVARLENTLARQPYVLGDSFSAADVLVGGALEWSRDLFPESPILDAYLRRLGARPAHQNGAAKDTARGLQTVR